MSDFIAKPYLFADNENEILTKHFKTYVDWENVVFNDLKSNIIKHLREEQKNKCCYCKRELGFDIKSVDIEHIIPKSKYEQFTFFPKNLALSCPGCNTKKGMKEVLKTHIVRYPKDSVNFKIIHAHYDNYSQNIKILDDCVFVALSSKGSETITICELFRLIVVEENAKKSKSKTDIAKLTDLIINADENDVLGLIEVIKTKIKK